jgi:hypothetical protein
LATVVKISRRFAGKHPLRRAGARRIVGDMPRSRFAACCLILLSLVFGAARAGAGPAPAITVAIADFTYADTSGEPTDQQAAHERRLAALVAGLRRDVAADGRFRVVALACGAAACTGEGEAPADLLHAAAEAGATILVLGGVHKMSTLIQWARLDAIDVKADRVIMDRLFTFRGDSDEAWRRAEAFMAGELRAPLAPADHR